MAKAFDQVLVDVRIDDLPRRRVCRAEPSTPLGEIYRRLDEERGVAVLICDGPELLGIFTERDILYSTALEGSLDTPIGDLMTRDLVTISRDDALVDAIRTMSEKGIRHLPVLGSDGEEAGLIGGRDVLKMIADYFPGTLLNLPPRLHQTMDRPEGG